MRNVVLRLSPWTGIASILGAAIASFIHAGPAWMWFGFAALVASPLGWLGLSLGLVCRLSFAAFSLSLAAAIARADPGASRKGASGRPGRAALGARLMCAAALMGAIALLVPPLAGSGEGFARALAIVLSLVESLAAGLGFALVTYWIRARKDMAEEGVYARASLVGFIASVFGAWGGSLIGGPATGAIGYLAALSLFQWAASFTPKLLRKLGVAPTSSQARP